MPSISLRLRSLHSYKFLAGDRMDQSTHLHRSATVVKIRKNFRSCIFLHTLQVLCLPVGELVIHFDS